MNKTPAKPKNKGGRPRKEIPKVDMTPDEVAKWIFRNAKPVSPVSARTRRNRA